MPSSEYKSVEHALSKTIPEKSFTSFVRAAGRSPISPASSPLPQDQLHPSHNLHPPSPHLFTTTATARTEIGIFVRARGGGGRHIFHGRPRPLRVVSSFVDARHHYCISTRDSSFPDRCCLLPKRPKTKIFFWFLRTTGNTYFMMYTAVCGPVYSYCISCCKPG